MPDYIENLKVRKPSRDKKISLITRTGVDEIIRNCNNARDKAIISILYYSGCRVSEILSLKISDIVYEEYCVISHFHGKTGNRILGIIGYSTAYLRDYIKIKYDGD
ncbi:TVG0908765 [Thermoplasma volcanium GSS1]|uniref:TVG0908765 protein n=1 Tax=Thermoplasma volcanium (strain ATCC 51530 / DSM 4299 / JCM 9571 / NBRC 15438 / GSS1) TaxID=273116 RepID=Q97AC0_THEVO|nr:site-specific integrase [Thermoplasma volcanium]BAB60032.1 TVG0908765 [Thermoplasma volcanium GSS1]